MLANFKKVGVAAAVAAALGASGAAQAVYQGTPGDALLVPYVYADEAKGVNTLIGVIVANPNLTDLADFTTVSPYANKFVNGVAGCAPGALHWYFYNKQSVHLADGVIPVTCEDFVRIDWNFISKTYPSVVGIPGYMVISDNRAAQATGTANSTLVLYGATYLIQGNWASQAYIPVLPLIDLADRTLNDEVEYDGIIVKDVIPVRGGMKLADKPGETAWFSLRYFLDPALKGQTTFVLWFPENNSGRDNQDIVVYDADEVGRSARTYIPWELNTLAVSPTATADGTIITGVIRDGLEHTNVDGAGLTAVGSAVNTGFVLFNVRDCSAAAISAGACTAVNGPNDNPSSGRAGFAFSLIGIGGGVNPLQVQTELVHERGLTGE